MKRRGKVIQSSLSVVSRSKLLPCDPPPRFPPSWSSGEIVRSNEIMSLHESWLKSKPLITKSLDFRDLVHAADIAIIPARAIRCSGHLKRLIELDQTKNQDPSSPYHVQWPECKEIEVKSSQDLHSLLQLKETKIQAKSPLFTLATSNNQPMIYMNNERIEPIVAKPLCSWLSTRLPLVKESSVSLECISRDTLLPLRYSAEGALLIQVTGSSRILLVPPSLTSLAPFCRSHPLHRYSAVGVASTASPSLDMSLVDHVATLWPTSSISGLSGIISSGEALFVPPGWSIHRETMEISTCLVVHLETKAPCSALASVLQSSSIIERWVDHEVGVSGARRFLIELIQIWQQHEFDLESFVSSISSMGRLERPPPRHWSESWPLDTVKGFKAIRLSSEIHEVCCQLVKIDPAIKKTYHVLEAIIKGRLLPTDWLNEYGLKSNQVPSAHLSLPWSYAAPRLEEDEKLFPQLFRRQIEIKEAKAAEAAHQEREERLKRLEGGGENRGLRIE